MDKVKLPREVAEAIEALRNMDFKVTNSDIIYAFAASTASEYPALVDFAADNFDTFLKALVNGYEVEETPEEKVRIMFDGKRPEGYNLGEVLAYRKGILDTLDAFGITVKGVNGHD